MPNCVIQNGTVIDGSGRPGFPADVVIEGDRIAAVERTPSAPPPGCRTVDATGKVVCPGMIDCHSHADLTIHRADHAKLLAPLVRQGITTFIGGNCGISMAPLGSEHYASAKMYLEGFTARSLDRDVHWPDTTGFMDHLERQGLALNSALLAPHGLIRMEAIGMANRHATGAEIGRMGRTLAACMDAGCIGLSTGLQYMPGLESNTDELVQLGRVLRRYDGIFTSHLRSYMRELPRAVDEVIAVARENGIRGQVSHLIWVPDYGPLNPLVHGAARALVRLSRRWTAPIRLDAAVAREIRKLDDWTQKGVPVAADVMPTTTTFTHLAAYLPPWVINGSKEEVVGRLRDPRTRREIRRDIEQGKAVWPHSGRNRWSMNILKLLGWESTILMSVATEANRPLEGKSLAEVGRLRGRHPFDAMCDLLLEEEARVLVFTALGEPEDRFTEQSIFAGIRHPGVAISTDAILLGLGRPSHLFHGAFPRILGRYVREKRMLSLETAVRKCSGLPAEHFRLDRRGRVETGFFADLVVFDPATVAPNCDFQNPAGTPSGIEHVFINGRHVVDRGTADLAALPGRLLRRGG